MHLRQCWIGIPALHQPREIGDKQDLRQALGGSASCFCWTMAARWCCHVTLSVVSTLASTCAYYLDWLQVLLPHENSPPEAHGLAVLSTLRAQALYVLKLALYFFSLGDLLADILSVNLGGWLVSFIFNYLQPNIATSNVVVGSLLTGCTIAIVTILSRPGCCAALLAAVQAVQPSSFLINTNISAQPIFQLYHMIQMFIYESLKLFGLILKLFGLILKLFGLTLKLFGLTLKLFGLAVVCYLCCSLAMPYLGLVVVFCRGSDDPHDPIAKFVATARDAGMELPLWWPINTDAARRQQCHAFFWDIFKGPFVAVYNCIVPHS